MQLSEKELREKSKGLAPILWIGKNGITDALVEELDKLLKRKKLVKIKLLRSFIENKNRKDVAVDIAKKTCSRIIDNVGFTLTLYRK